MDDQLIKQLQETDLFAGPSDDEVRRRTELRMQQVNKAGITRGTITQVAPNILRSGGGQYVVGWVIGYGANSNTRVRGFKTRDQAKAFQKELMTQVVQIDEAKDLFAGPSNKEIGIRRKGQKEREQAKLKDFPIGTIVKAYRAESDFDREEQGEVVETEVNWAGNPLVNVKFNDGTTHWYHPDWLYGQ